jgi:hypothetical protein
MHIWTRFATYTLRYLEPCPAGVFETIDFEVVDFVAQLIKTLSYHKQQNVDILQLRAINFSQNS